MPNALNGAILLAGCGSQIWRARLTGLLDALMGAGVGFALVLVPFAIRLYRGGDAKLVIALGAWLGPLGALWTFLWGAALGGIGALVMVLTMDRAARQRVRQNLELAARTATLPQVEARASRSHVPMAVAFSAGAVVTLVWRSIR